MSTKMKQTLLRVSLPLLVLAAGVGAGSVVINSRSEPETATEQALLRSVNAVRARPDSVAVMVDSQGSVTPGQRISLVPQVSGQIVWVADNFVNGGEFAAGDTLLRIDARDYRLAVTTAEANVADAEQQLETVRAQAEQAAADWAMVKRRQPDASEPTALALRKPQLAGAEARLLSARAELERARLQLSRTDIVAPFNGVLSEKQVDFGQYIAAGAQLGRLSSSDLMEVRLALPERELRHLPLRRLEGEGIPVTLTLLSQEQGARWSGRLVRSEGMLDERTRNLTLVARLRGDELSADDGSRLIPGQFVRASIRGREYSDVFHLPRTALHNAASVFVIDAEGRLQETRVELLDIAEDHIVVSGGLEAGQLVSISPLTSSAHGQRVLPIEAASDMGAAAL